MRTPYPYQKSMIDYLKKTPNAALYVDMRLGKSFCTIRALRSLPGRKLIVCPKSVIPTWCNELEAEGIQDYLWFSSEFLKRFKNPSPLWPQWIVCNYEAIQRMKSLPFKHVVIDESVVCKSPTAKLTKFLIQNFQDVERKILLSGNPAPNSPLEYFSQMQFLFGRWMNCDNYWQFRKRYFTSDFNGWNWWARNSSKDSIRIELQKSCYFLSRKDVGVANKKVYEKRYVEMPSEVRKKYREMEKEFATSLPDGTKLETKWVLSQLLFLQELAGGHILGQEVSRFKIRELKTLLEGELKGESVLIWCRFRWEIKMIEEELGCVSISGETPLSLREKYQKDFQSGERLVLCLQVATSKYGLNLSRSSTSIYFSNTFNLDDRDQSEMRIEHNDKKEPLLYIDLVSKGTVEEEILKALQQKRKQAGFYREVIKGIKERVK